METAQTDKAINKPPFSASVTLWWAILWRSAICWIILTTGIAVILTLIYTAADRYTPITEDMLPDLGKVMHAVRFICLFVCPCFVIKYVVGLQFAGLHITFHGADNSEQVIFQDEQEAKTAAADTPPANKNEPIDLFEKPHIAIAASFALFQPFFMYLFIVNGYGFAFVLMLVLFINAAFLMQVKRHVAAGKVLKPFSAVKGYVILTTAYYAVPLFVMAVYWIFSLKIHPVGQEFLYNNTEITKWIAGLNLPGLRPILDLNNPANVLNIYLQSLAVAMCVLSVFISLFFLPLLVKDWRAMFRAAGDKQTGFTEVIRIFVFTILCGGMLTIYNSYYSYGHKIGVGGAISPFFERQLWLKQVGVWAYTSFTFPLILSGLIATILDVVSPRKKTQAV